jgi:hypothetical protein
MLSRDAQTLHSYDDCMQLNRDEDLCGTRIMKVFPLHDAHFRGLWRIPLLASNPSGKRPTVISPISELVRVS